MSIKVVFGEFQEIVYISKTSKKHEKTWRLLKALKNRTIFSKSASVAKIWFSREKWLCQEVVKIRGSFFDHFFDHFMYKTIEMKKSSRSWWTKLNIQYVLIRILKTSKTSKNTKKHKKTLKNRVCTHKNRHYIGRFVKKRSKKRPPK